MIRRELRAALRPWYEALAAVGAVLVALWVALLGGWFFALIGGSAVLVALAWLLGSVRRARFRRDVAVPGMVEVDEGAIRYFGARLLGGEMALRDLAEIRLLVLRGHPHWRLKSRGGQALLIPAEAAGADALADAFTALPGIDMGRLAQALAGAGSPGLLWSRAGEQG